MAIDVSQIPEFRLRRQEEIVATLINYVAGHTDRISDFNEGSITRSIMEGIAQELFRQNVVFAQQVSGAIRDAVKNAFGLPLRTKANAYGTVNFYRKLLDSPENLASSLTDAVLAKMTATEISSIAYTNGGSLPAATYYYAVCPIFCGEGLYAHLENSDTTVVIAANEKGYGYHDGDVVTLDGGDHLRKIKLSVSSTTGLVTSASVVSAGSGYSGVTGAAAIASPRHGVGIGSNILSISTAANSAVTFQIKNVVGAGRFLIFRSTNKYFLNSTCWQVQNMYASEVALTRNSTSTMTVRDPGIGNGTGLRVTITASNTSPNAVEKMVVTTAGTGYSNGTLISVASPTVGGTAATAIICTNDKGYTGSSAPTDQGQVVSLVMVTGGTGFASGNTTNVAPVIADDRRVPFPGSKWYWAITANNSGGKSAASLISSSGAVVTNAQKATISWNPVKAADTQSAPKSYSVWRTAFAINRQYPYEFMATQVDIGSTSGGLSNGTYWYSISAIYSDCAESMGCTPISFTVVNGSMYRHAKLSWIPVFDAVAYRIYRASDSAMTTNLYCVDIENIGQSTFRDTGSIFESNLQPRRWPRLATVNATVSSATNGFWRQDDTGSGGTVSYPYYNSDGIAFSDVFYETPTAPSISGPITIGARTRVQVPGTAKLYEVPYETIMNATSNYVPVTVIAAASGTNYNTQENTITKMVTPIYGIESISNPDKITNGEDQETEEEWKIRFSRIIDSMSRGTSSSMESGALSAQVKDSKNLIIETVKKSIVRDFGINSITLNIHNGKNSGASQLLVSKCQQIIDGYVDDDGTVYAGYKPAGIPVTVKAASVIEQDIFVEFSTYLGISPSIIIPAVKNAVTEYFDTLDISEGMIPPSIFGYSNSSGSIEYQYQVLAVNNIGGRTLPSNTLYISNGQETPNNTIKWNKASTSTGYPTITKYDIIRWNQISLSWELVEQVDASTSDVQTYTDTSTTTTTYYIPKPVRKMLVKNEISQKIMLIPGVASAKVYFDPMSKYIKNSTKKGFGLKVDSTIAQGSTELATISIHTNGGGSYYSIGDVLEVPGYNASYGRPAIIMVTNINSSTGAATEIKVMSSGYGYLSAPSNSDVLWLNVSEPEYIIPAPGSIIVPGNISVQ